MSNLEPISGGAVRERAAVLLREGKTVHQAYMKLRREFPEGKHLSYTDLREVALANGIRPPTRTPKTEAQRARRERLAAKKAAAAEPLPEPAGDDVKVSLPRSTVRAMERLAEERVRELAKVIVRRKGAAAPIREMASLALLLRRLEDST